MCLWGGGVVSTRPEYTTRAGFLVNHLAFTKDLQITNNHSCQNYFKGAEVSASTAPVTAPRHRLCARRSSARRPPQKQPPPAPSLGPGLIFLRAACPRPSLRYRRPCRRACDAQRANRRTTRCVVGTARLQRMEPTRDSQHWHRGTQHHTRTSLAYLVAQCPWCWVPLQTVLSALASRTAALPSCKRNSIKKKNQRTACGDS